MPDQEHGGLSTCSITNLGPLLLARRFLSLAPPDSAKGLDISTIRAMSQPNTPNTSDTPPPPELVNNGSLLMAHGEPHLTPAMPSPTEPPPVTRPQSLMGPPPKPAEPRSSSMSNAAVARSSNSLSLSFPVQSLSGPGSRNSTPPSPASSNATPSLTMNLSEHSASRHAEPNSFLVALAAQERRVLELKEELSKAEVDLEKLKRQWAMQEATKKRAELRRTEPLQPLNTTLASLESSGDESSGSVRLTKEMERRKMLTSLEPRNARRKVISGNGHTRALSLLSPDRTNSPLSAGPLDHSRKSFDMIGEVLSAPRSSGLPASKSMPAALSAGTEELPRRMSYHGIPKDDILKSGRRMAEDFKEGLWTFIDDLRQATVGDEAVNGVTRLSPKRAQRQGSKTSLKSPKPQSTSPTAPAGGKLTPQGRVPGKRSEVTGRVVGSLADKARTAEEVSPITTEGHDAPLETTPVARRGQSHELDDESWESWDTPSPKAPSPRWSSSTTVSDRAVSPSQATEPSPNDSNGPASSGIVSIAKSALPKREDIPWPNLSTISPKNLRHTASNLMNEWEKSLAIPQQSKSGQDPASSPSTSPTPDPVLDPRAM